MVIRITDDVLLHVRVIMVGVGLVLHPEGHSEIVSQVVVECGLGDNDRVGSSIEFVDLVALVTIVGGEATGPFGADARAREEVNAVRAGTWKKDTG